MTDYQFHISTPGSKKTLCGLNLRTLGLNTTMTVIAGLNICDDCLKSTVKRERLEVTK